MLEFSDLEHYTLSILQKNEDIRQDLEERYAEIMVDEYQDTNELQETDLSDDCKKIRRQHVHGGRRQAVDLWFPSGRSGIVP